MLEGERGCSRPRRPPELPEDVAEVPSHRLLTEEQLTGDRPVALAGGDEAEHLHLTRGQPARRLGGVLRRQRLHPGEVGRGAQLLEDPARRAQLHLRGIRVAQRPAGEPDQHPARPPPEGLPAPTQCASRSHPLPPPQAPPRTPAPRPPGTPLAPYRPLPATCATTTETQASARQLRRPARRLHQRHRGARRDWCWKEEEVGRRRHLGAKLKLSGPTIGVSHTDAVIPKSALVVACLERVF